jgi:hypothetical protein
MIKRFVSVDDQAEFVGAYGVQEEMVNARFRSGKCNANPRERIAI